MTYKSLKVAITGFFNFVWFLQLNFERKNSIFAFGGGQNT